MTKIGMYPGSFDPITYGHLDLIDRGSKLFDFLYIAISKNADKKNLFTSEERKEMIEEVTKKYTNVKVVINDMLIADFAKEFQVKALLRGLRAITDFEYEMQMASTNHLLNPNLETVFMMTKTEYSYLSSSIVKEVARYKGDLSNFVPPYIERKIVEKLFK